MAISPGRARHSVIPLGASWNARQRSLPGYRALVACCQALSIWLTWPLWSGRDTPPLLPLLPIPDIPFGLLLLISLPIAVVLGSKGAVLHAGLLGIAMMADQTRLQPWAISLALLLLASGGHRSWLLIGRSHLIALWCWAGASKLIGGAFVTATATPIVAAWWVGAPSWFAVMGGTGIAVAEVALGISTALLRWRRFVGWGALLLQAGIIVALLPRTEHRNVTVWPWNVALAVSGFALVGGWNATLGRDVVAAPAAARIGALVLLLSPAGFYLGIMDAYVAHHLYAGDVASAVAVCPTGCRSGQDPNDTWAMLGVPLPPQPRLFESLFLRRCERGDLLRLVIPWPTPWSQAEKLVPCSAAAGPPAYP